MAHIIPDPTSGSSTPGANSTFENLKDKATDTLESVSAEVGSFAQSVSNQAQKVGDDAQAFTHDLKTSAERTIRDRPMTTLAVALAGGFLFGVLWKSRPFFHPEAKSVRRRRSR